ncbi:MAG: helix-turn-helix transcriptional regulator [Henriciella sp.]|nr:helix-turn-helix transcriptional regulator [Henriciella sp.]
MTDLENTALTASEVDRLVGDRIRRRRILMGLTQDQLGDSLGISYQQIQKYETGANRVSAGRLYLIATRLDVSPGWFFDPVKSDASSDDFDELGSSRLLMEFVRSFARIKDERLKSVLVSLVRAMTDDEEPTITPTNGAGSDHHANPPLD